MHAIAEADPNFSPDGLSLQPSDGLTNDVTVVGLTEPQDYVKDYFVGDGVSLKFYLSQTPFSRPGRTLLDEEYAGTALDPALWTATDPASAVTVSNGKLQVAGGTGVDGAKHGGVRGKDRTGGSAGAAAWRHRFQRRLGRRAWRIVSQRDFGRGLPGGISHHAERRAIDHSRLVSGATTGTTITTVTGHHYALTTRFYATEIYRRRQIFHSAGHPPGADSAEMRWRRTCGSCLRSTPPTPRIR